MRSVLGCFWRHLWLLTLRRGIGRPEMAATIRTGPKLLRRPRTIWHGVLEIHLFPTPLAANLDIYLMHKRILTRS